MGGPRTRLASLLVVVLLLSLLPAAPAMSASEDAATATSTDLDAAIAFRKKLGLRSDRAFVVASLANRAFKKARWGIPLADAEAAELQRRVDDQQALARAARKAAKDPASAGAYIDQASGGIPVFLTTGDPARARRDVDGLIPARLQAKVRFERVARSADELAALHARVVADLETGLLPPDVTSVALDARANSVVVGAPVVTEDLRDQLATRYGAGVRLELEAPGAGGDDGEPCYSRSDCRPAKGGLEIDASGTGAACTTGLLVRVAGSNEVRVLTAGHCVGRTGGTGTSRTWRHNGTTFAWSEFYVWNDGADADVGLLTPNASSVGSERNIVFESSTADLVPMQSFMPTADQIQGTLVCRAGATSGSVCGTIIQTNATKSVDGHSIDHQWVVDFDACPGDSGGPYTIGDVALGIHTDSTVGCAPTKNQAWYSPVEWALTVLANQGHPVVMCTETTCGAGTNAWTTRGPLSESDAAPTLVKLDDGRVLSIGGHGAEPELFDPATGDWSGTAREPWSPDRCEGQFALRLADDRVLVGGGRIADGLAASGPGGDPCAGNAYVFDPSGGGGGSWDDAAALPANVVWAGAALLSDGRAFVTGGAGDDGTASVALAYSPGSDSWEALTGAPESGLGPLVIRLDDGRVLVSGGRAVVNGGPGYSHVAASFLYDPEADAWTPTGLAGTAGAAGLRQGNGRIVVAGGRQLSWNGSQSATFSTKVAQLNPATGAWTQLAALRTGRADFTFVELDNGQLLAAGGLLPGGASGLGGSSGTADIYDPASGAWYTAPRLKEARNAQGAAKLDDGSVLVAGGGVASSETFVPGDVLPPSISGTPSWRGRAATILGNVPITITWAASDVGGSGVGTYDVARSTDGAAFTTIATTVTGTALDTAIAAGHKYRFQIRPRDWAGNLGGWKAGGIVIGSVVQQSSSSVSFSSGWTTRSGSAFSGGSAKASRYAGASATFTFTGRAVSFVTTRSPERGSAKIYVDGVYVTTVSLYAATQTSRYVAFQKTWSSSGQHRIKVVVVGTSGHPRIDVDAFTYLRPG